MMVPLLHNKVCENNDEEEIRKIYDFEEDNNARRVRSMQHFNQHRYVYDPDGLLGSNCTLQPTKATP